MAVSQATIKKGQDTVEYQAFKKNFDFIVSRLQYNRQHVANSLFSKSLILQDELEKVSNRSDDDFSKATSLLTIVLSKVEADPSKLSTFVDVLQDRGMTDFADRILESTDISSESDLSTSNHRLNSGGSELVDSAFSLHEKHFIFIEDETSQDSLFDQENGADYYNESIESNLSFDPESEAYRKFVSYRDTIKSQEITIENQKREIESFKNLQKAKESELRQLKQDMDKASQEKNLILEEKLKAVEAMNAERTNSEKIRSRAIEMEEKVAELTKEQEEYKREENKLKKEFKEKEESLQKQIEKLLEKKEEMSLDLKKIEAQLAQAEVKHLKEQKDLIDKNHELEKIRLQLEHEVKNQELTLKHEKRTILAEKNAELAEKNTELAVKKAKLAESEKDLAVTKQKCAEMELLAVKKKLKQICNERSPSH